MGRVGGRRGGSVAPELPIGLIALDIDGTIVGPNLVLGERTRQAIGQATSRGVPVSLVTGRMASSALRFARELELTEPIVAYQGGLIRAMPARGSERIGRLLFHRPLPAAVAREVILWSRSRGLDPHINHLERFILRADDPNAADYSRFMGSRAELVPDIAAAVVHPVTKVLAVSDDPLDGAVLAEARAHFEGRADVTISHPRFLEFIAPGVSKGRAVRWLARRLGVPLARTLAIGDQYNDLEMIAAVGHGAAMPTAPAPVRLAARYIAPSVDAEGSAEIIERLVLAPRDEAEASADALEREAALARPAAEAEEAELGAARLHEGRITGATEAASLGRPK